MENELALVPAAGDALQLADNEQALLHAHVVIGLPIARAAELAGVKPSSAYVIMKRPHVMLAAEKLRLIQRGRTEWTRDDVVAGLADAIDQAKVMADPMAQIAGFREIAKLKGYDKTPNINLHLTGTPDQIKKQMAALPTADLLALSSNDDVLDADFYRVDTSDGDDEEA